MTSEGDRFPETPADLAALERTDPARFDRLMQQNAVAQAAWAFLVPAVVDGDLQSVWHLVDLTLRAQLAWQWVENNQDALRADGHNLQTAAMNIIDLPAGTKPLWEHFERAHVRGLRAAFPDPAHWGIGTELRSLADGLALVNVVDKRDLTDGETWQPGEQHQVYPVVLRNLNDEWTVASLGANPMVRQSNTLD